jgi:uncharacterized membrane protein
MAPPQRARSILSRTETTDTLKTAFVRGLAILLPLVVTLLVLSIVFGFIAGVTSPLVTALVRIPGVESRVVVTLVTLVVFGALVVGIGLAAEYGLGNGRVGAQFDAFMSELPGIGSLYNGFNEVSELLLDSDTDSFQEVKLVEYPKEGSYVVAFKTADTAERIESAADGDEMVTLFVPMAPNPVMGGFVVHTERDRVVDVDLTVEEGIRSVVTSGVSVGTDSPLERPADAGSLDAESRLEGGSDGTAGDP